MYKRALKGKKASWGQEHTSTLDTVNNLGNLYKNQGRFREAEASTNGHSKATSKRGDESICRR